MGGNKKKIRVKASQVDPERFSQLKDPRFASQTKKEDKPVLDERFAPLFQNEDFQLPTKYDRYGRPNASNQGRDDLSKLYQTPSAQTEISSSSEDESKNGGGKASGSTKAKKGKSKKKLNKNILTENLGNEYFSVDPSTLKGKKKKIHTADINRIVARKEGFESSSEEEEDNYEDLEVDSENEEEVQKILDDLDQENQGDYEIGDSSYRIAVEELNWDLIKSQDLFVLASSFCPTGGYVQNVVMYPTEFGLECLEKENNLGPQAIWNSYEELKYDENEEGKKIKLTKKELELRKLARFQKERKKYYFAIITCDSRETAENIYFEAEGLEIEGSGDVLNLSYVPDSMDFDDKEEIERCDSNPDNYQPVYNLGQENNSFIPKCTWDMTDPKREAKTKKKFHKKFTIEDLEKDDMTTFLASSDESESSDDDEDVVLGEGELEEGAAEQEATEFNPKKRQKYLSLLQSLKPQSKDKHEKVSVEFSMNLNPMSNGGQQSLIESDEDEKESSSDSEEEASHRPRNFELELTKEERRHLQKKEYRKKKKEKLKQQRREELAKDTTEYRKQRADLELLSLPDNFDPHQNAEPEISKKAPKKASKRAKVEQDVEEEPPVDLSDNRIQRIFNDPNFAIDPTSSHFKKTKGAQKVLEERLKRRKEKIMGK